ncbi:MAG: hypothetical protein AAF206_11320 [Bacteroidota bacterium]
MKYFAYILTLGLLSLTCHLPAQQLSQKIEMNLDKLGNANLTLSMKMGASQWQNWIQSLGNNPAALKRQVERDMPAFFLDDFQLEKNDMERSFTLSLKAYGVCKVDKRGNWVLETDDKDVDLTELTDHKFMYVNSPAEYGGQLQQTTIVEFPEEAQAIKVDEDAYGKTVFKFDMEGDAGGGGWMRYTGIVLCVLGAAWAGWEVLRNR